jgi:hypothetical protein
MQDLSQGYLQAAALGIDGAMGLAGWRYVAALGSMSALGDSRLTAALL